MKLFKLWDWLFPAHFYQTSVAAAVVGGAAISAGASMAAGNKAAGAQRDAANQANATTMAQYNQTREDNLPSMYRGNEAGNQLSMLMGLNLGPNGYAPSQDNFDTQAYLAANPDVAAAIGTPKGPPSAWWHYQNYGKDEGRAFTPTQQALAQAQAMKSNPLNGTLSRNFTADDLASDPVYNSGLQFGLDQGVQGINRLAAAGGSFDSGKTLKELTRFGNDYGSTKANESYNRFNTNKMNTYNMLSGIAGTGQVATNQVGAAGQAAASSVAQNQIGVGNARAASSIGGANALTGALGQGWNAYQGNRLMNLYGGGGSGLSSYTPAYAGTGSGGWTSGYDLMG